MSSVVTTSENGLKMKIKRKSSLGKIVSDVENIAGTQITSPFKQKFVLESDSNEKKKTETVTKLSAKILQTGKNKGKNKKQSKPSKEKKIKKRIHRVGSATNISKCLSSADKTAPDCLGESNSLKPNCSDVSSGRERDASVKKESVASTGTFPPPSENSDHQSGSRSGFQTSSDINSVHGLNQKSEEKKVPSVDKGTEMTTKDVETETSHIGVITDPDCLGPCEPGTSVVLEGIVWNESDNGILVVNVTWRGKTYVGTLMDSTKHHWAPPRFSEEELNASAQSNYGGWGGSTIHHQKSRTDETRKPRRCRKDAAALVSYQTRLSKATGTMSFSNAKDIHCTSNSDIQSKNKVGLFECQEENCGKKFKHLAGLRYHQSHAHCKKKEKDESMAIDSRHSPSGKPSNKLLTGRTTEELPEKDATNLFSCSSASSAYDPDVSTSSFNSSQPAVATAEEVPSKSTPDVPKPSPLFEILSSQKDDSKSSNTTKATDTPSVISTKNPETLTDRPSPVESLTKETKPAEKATAMQSSPVAFTTQLPSKKETCDSKTVFREIPAVSTEGRSQVEVRNEVRNEVVEKDVPNIYHRSLESKESIKKHSSSSFLPPSEMQKQSSSLSSSSFSSNLKKHPSTSESSPTAKRMKMAEDSRAAEDDPFYRAFRSMFENAPLPLDYFIDPFYRAQSFSMMGGDPLLFHKNLLDSRNRISKSSFDDLKPVDMSSKKTLTPKPEAHGFWPSYLPPATTTQGPSHFFGPLKDCGSDVTSRSINENFPSPLPPAKEKSLPKLQRFGSSSRFLDSGGSRCPSTGNSREEGAQSKSYDRDFHLKHRRSEDFSGQKNGKLKEDPRKSASNYSKQDVFRSPLPPPLLPSSFSFFPSQHQNGFSTPHISPHPLESMEKSSINPRHQTSHHSPTVGERFKFPSALEPLSSKQGGGLGGRMQLASGLSTPKSHTDIPPAPKHHLHTHHHTHIIKAPYPMYSQYAASLLTTPPIVPTVVVPEIFSPK